MKTKLAGMGGAPTQTFVDDVFSTYLYTGTGVTQTITNGIDLAGKGGLVWIKERSSTESHSLWDTARGAGYRLSSNETGGQANYVGDQSFTSSGFSFGNITEINASGQTFASWTFRKAAKFFDVVTYTGTGSARTIAHNLGVAPGMIIVKRTDTTGNWQVYSNGLTSAAYSMQLNSTAAQASAPTVWNSTAPTSSVFSVGTDSTVNASGGTYVAYLFAHDTSSTGIIQCGSFTTDSSGTATAPINLGWEPQYFLMKTANQVGAWLVVDSMRGLGTAGSRVPYLLPYSSAAEANSSSVWGVTATGINITGANANCTYIYMAIRMPNKPPTTGTQVYSPVLGSTNISAPDYLWFTTPFPVDLVIQANRTTNANKNWWDRLRGSGKVLASNLTDAEGSGVFEFDVQNGVQVSSAYAGSNVSYEIGWNFKRAPGFFDEVCYTGNGATSQTLAHNLGVAPELLIVKRRSATANWVVNGQLIVADTIGLLNSSNAFGGAAYDNGFPLNGTVPASNFRVGFGVVNNDAANASGSTYVAYLFATCAGVSKVGVYTGNGTGQAIACGFSAGARFVLIKRTDSTGDWYTFDSARGLTVGSSPYLLLNSTAAETTGNNGVYASTGGFTLGSTASTTTNINAATYIFLAVA